MIKNKKLIRPLLLALLMTGMTVQAVEEPGRLYIPLSELPGELIGHKPGMEAWVTTSSKDGKIYTGNVLTLNYRIVDADLDWADDALIKQTVYWYFLKPTANGGYEPDGDAFASNTLTVKVPEKAVGRVIGVSVGPKTAVGVPNESGFLEIFNVKDTFSLVPEGLEANYGNRPAGSVFSLGPVSSQNNINELLIQFCPDGEYCEGSLTGPQDPISKPGIYIYDITGMENADLKALDQAGRRFTETNKAHASVAKTYRAVIFDEVEGVLKDITDEHMDVIVWSLQEKGQANMLFTKTNILNFKTQTNNDNAKARSRTHLSEQGLSIKVSAKW